MSTTTTCVLRFCDTCGNTRTAAERAGWRLKCEACGITTHHAKPYRDSPDYRETDNGRHNEKVRALVWLESVYEQFGIEVRYDVAMQIEYLKGGHRALYATSHNLHQGEHVWTVEVSRHANLQGRINALRSALRAILSENVDYWKQDEPSGWHHAGQWNDFADN